MDADGVKDMIDAAVKDVPPDEAAVLLKDLPGEILRILAAQDSAMTEDDVLDMIDVSKKELPSIARAAARAVADELRAADAAASVASADLRTKGLSPKLYGPVAAPLGAFVYQLIVTGTLNRPALGAAAVALIGLALAYAAPHGVVPSTKES